MRLTSALSLIHQAVSAANQVTGRLLKKETWLGLMGNVVESKLKVYLCNSNIAKIRAQINNTPPKSLREHIV